jgi:hypothetical protein
MDIYTKLFILSIGCYGIGLVLVLLWLKDLFEVEKGDIYFFKTPSFPRAAVIFNVLGTVLIVLNMALGIHAIMSGGSFSYSSDEGLVISERP